MIELQKNEREDKPFNTYFIRDFLAWKYIGGGKKEAKIGLPSVQASVGTEKRRDMESCLHASHKFKFKLKIQNKIPV